MEETQPLKSTPVIAPGYTFRSVTDKISAIVPRRARRLMALSFPTGAWYMRAGEKVMNFVMWLTRSGFRFYVPPPQAKPSSPPPRRRACARFCPAPVMRQERVME